MRFFHISDIHVGVPRPGWRFRDLPTKRATSWLNWTVAGRGQRFANAAHVLDRFRDLMDRERPNAIIFTGDASAFGFTSEIATAGKLLGVGDYPGIATPGNHDYYTRDAQRSLAFERTFEPWLHGERVDSETYPFAKRIDGIWFVSVNTSTPNPLFWDARGQTGRRQIARLDHLLKRLPAGPRVLVTHYPFATATGHAEPYWHGLRDRTELFDVARQNGVRLWLCGHRHHGYIVSVGSPVPLTVVCAGSATMSGESRVFDIRIQSERADIQSWQFNPKSDQFAMDDSSPHGVKFTS